MKKSLSRRAFLKAAGLGAAGGILVACQPKTVIVEKEVEKVVTQVVKETVKETVIVAGTPKVVEKEVTKVVTAVPEEPITLTVASWFHGQDVPSEGENWIQSEIEGAFNIKFDAWVFERWTSAEQLNARLAGGEIPDRWGIEGGLSQAEFIEQDLITEVPIELLAEAAPRIFAATLKYQGGDMVCWLGGNNQGKNYSVPSLTTTQTHPFCDGWRKDSLDKAGITRLPETIEEHEAALTALVEKGVHEFALTPRLGDWVQGSFLNIHGAFGSFPHHWIPDPAGDGVVHGSVSDGARQAVEVVQRMWSNGLVNPESLTTKWKDLVNQWCQGRTGYVDCGTWYRLIPGGELYDCIWADGGETVHAWAPKGPEGKFGYPGWGHAGASGYFGRQLAQDDTKMRKLLEVEDAIRGDPYWATVRSYGKQGEHYYRDEELGLQRKTADEMPVPLEKVGYWFIGNMWGAPIPDIWYAWQGSLLPQQIEKAFAGNTEWLPELGGFMDPEMCQDFTEMGPTQDQWYVAFYSGEKPMSEWDSFVNEYMDAGGKCNFENANEGFKNRNSILQSIKTKVEEIAG